MNHKQIKKWFSEFTALYEGRRISLPIPLQRKLRHSHAVALNAAGIASELLMEPEHVRLAEMAGLLHDIGRWPQYETFQTFRDSESKDHGALGADVLKQHRVLADCSDHERACLEAAVRHHNAKDVPSSVKGDALRFTQIVRDSDKLDIYEIVIGLMQSGEMLADPTLRLNTDPNGPLTPEAMLEVRERKSVSFRHIHSLNDFLLTLLSWTYDINCQPTYNRLANRKVLARLSQFLPHTTDVESLFQAADMWVRTCKAANPNE